MSRVDVYIFRQVLTNTCFIGAILGITVFLVQSVKLIELIVTRGMTLESFGWLALLALPKLSSYVLPIALFIGLIMTYHRMNVDNEITVLKSSGFSNRRLVFPGMSAALAIALTGYLFSLYISPLAYGELQRNLDRYKTQWGSALLKEGRFTAFGNSITLYMESREGNRLYGLMYDNRTDPESPFTIFAEEGQVFDEGNGQRIVLKNGTRQTLINDRFQFISFEQSIVELIPAQASNTPKWRQPEERFLPDLLFPDPENATNKDHWNLLIIQGHRMLSQPLLNLALAAIALAAMLRPAFSRRGSWQPVLSVSALAAIVQLATLYGAVLAEELLLLIPLLYILPLAVALAGLMVAAWQTGDQTSDNSSPAQPDAYGYSVK